MSLFFGHNQNMGVITFTTNSSSSTWTPLTTTYDSSLQIWTIEGYGTIVANSPIFDLSGNTANDNLLVTVRMTDLTQWKEIQFVDLGIVGVLDISLLTNLGSRININNNSALSEIIFPITQNNNEFILLYIHSNGLASIDLDISMFNNLKGDLRIYGNGLNSISLTDNNISNNTFTQFRILNEPSISTIDITGFSGINGTSVLITDNTALTDVDLPTSAGNIDNIYVARCAIGVLDWNRLTGTIQDIDISDNGFTSAESDENIVSIDTNITLTTSLIIDGTNGVLTDGTVTGFDGLGAKDQLIIEGVSVTYN